MYHAMCRTVPPLLVLLIGSGCFLDHNADAGPADGAMDVLVPVDSAVPSEDVAPPRADAAPPVCEGVLSRATFACTVDTAGGSLWADRPSTLHVRVPNPAGVCAAAGAARCVATIAEDGVLELCTSIVPGVAPALCPAELEVECEIPPLVSERDWRVLINGEDAFEIASSDSRLALPVVQSCFDVAPVVDESLSCEWTGDLPSEWAGDPIEVCVPREIGPETRVIRFRNRCADCFNTRSFCEVRVSEDTSPPRIFVSARERRCDCPSCGACDPTCVRRDLVCRLPDLPPGPYTIEAGAAVIPVEFVDRPMASPERCEPYE